MDMELTVCLPDEIGTRLAASGRDLTRRALEALIVTEFHSGRLSKPEAKLILGFDTDYEWDGLLKTLGFPLEFTLTDFEREQGILQSLGR
jgi:hypothetical protein